MVRAVGIDPGTKSFEVCGLEDGEVFFEEVLSTSKLAEDPDLLIDIIEEAMPVDLIAGPSGYGVEITYLSDLDIEILEDWYLTYILLLTRDDLESALSIEDPGIMVYSAMVQIASEMKRRDWPVCYIPGVINLPTVPEWRKINKLDLGTVDKLCSCLLGIHDQSTEKNIPYSDTSFILVEMGYGYNSILAVESGTIVDGLGGTTNGPGFLTAGKMDLELVQLVGGWDKSDIFDGGAASVSEKDSPESLLKSRKQEEKSEIAWKGMMEGVERGVASMLTSVSEPNEILLSGRLTRMDEVRKELDRRLEKFAPVRRLGCLKGAGEVKKAAQGYAMAAEGLSDGEFSELIDRAKIKDAEGTALDYLYHPKGRSISEELKKKVPFRP
ncbi:MAG: DUF1464 family protein [Candidatus Thermoplasmatota archaeon]